MKNTFGYFYFPINRKELLGTTGGTEKRAMALRLLITLVTSLFLYGAGMGLYHSFLQSLMAGIKLNILFLFSAIICIPCFYIIQFILGSRLSVLTILIILFSGFTISAIISIAFIPIVAFFYYVDSSYHFLQLLHVCIFLFCSFFGAKHMVKCLEEACDELNIYPKIGLTAFRVWLVVFVIVGIQLAWNLRPFVAEKKEKFVFQGHYKGNLYTAIIYSFEHLNDETTNKAKKQATYIDTIIVRDTVKLKK